MTSFATVRDPVTDHLLTPQNAALVIIDFQPVQVSSVASSSSDYSDRIHISDDARMLSC